MGPGGIFGNIRGATKYLTMSNVTASRNIDLLCIQGRDFYALLKVGTQSKLYTQRWSVK